MNAIFQMLNPSNTLTVNRLLAHAIGLSEAVIYAALISKCSYYERNGMLDDGGWFYSTVPDLEASTALSEYQQKRCIKNLVESGLIESKNRGLPAKRCFRIIENIELISKLISEGEKKQMSIKPAAALSYEKSVRTRLKTKHRPLAPKKLRSKKSLTSLSQITPVLALNILRSRLSRNFRYCSPQTSVLVPKNPIFPHYINLKLINP